MRIILAEARRPAVIAVAKGRDGVADCDSSRAGRVLQQQLALPLMHFCFLYLQLLNVDCKELRKIVLSVY